MRRLSNTLERTGLATAAAALCSAASAHPVATSTSGDNVIGWSFDPLVLPLLLLSALLYGLGAWRLLPRARRARPAWRWRAGSFALGWLVLALALVSPLDGLGTALFSAHMVQHELLMIVAAPLLVMGRPLAVWLWAFPPRARGGLGQVLHQPWLRGPWRLLTTPLMAWVLHAVALWAWHVPRLFGLALADPGVHALQHTSFLASALLFWTTVLERRPARQPHAANPGADPLPGGGIAMLSLFTTMAHTTALGALLTLAPGLWYPFYALPTAALGFDPLQDQQLGGLVMWVPGGVAYLVGGLVVAARWLRAGPATLTPVTAVPPRQRGAAAFAAKKDGGAMNTRAMIVLACAALGGYAALPGNTGNTGDTSNTGNTGDAVKLSKQGNEGKVQLAASTAPVTPTATATAMAATTAKGAYLSKIGGCAACHTAPGGLAFAGGRGVPSPLGSINSSNITPDPVHGIGGYSFDDFRRAMREGTAAGGKHLYPAMPYTAYAKMNDDDLQSLYRYLRQDVAPVPADPPPTRLPFPFNQRWLLRFWKWAFAPQGVYQDTPEHDAAWNRGAYLTQSIGHCGACHTPRGVAFQERGYDGSSRHYLSGAVNDHWFGVNLTAERAAGMGRVAPEHIAALLRSGQANGMAVSGSMAEEVALALQYLSEDDARAIAVYLKSLPAQRGGSGLVPDGPARPTLADGDHTGDLESVGAAAYRGFCASCHQAGGEGVSGVFPRLKGNPSVLSQDASSLIRIVVEGGRPPSTAQYPEPPAMPAFAGTLTDVQQAQVLSYIRSAWGNSAEPVTTSDVSQLRSAIRK